MKYGVGSDGNAMSEKPEEIEQLLDWCKPGGPRNRENCVKLLVEQGASVLEADYQGFTVLHFAAMWGNILQFFLNYFQEHAVVLKMIRVCRVDVDSAIPAGQGRRR